MASLDALLQLLRPTSTTKFGTRIDGTPKGSGFFGTLQRLDDPNQFSTELSADYDVDGKRIFGPSIVPTMTRQELEILLSGGQPTRRMDDKIISHALGRIKAGKSPFAQEGEQITPPTGIKLFKQ